MGKIGKLKLTPTPQVSIARLLAYSLALGLLSFSDCALGQNTSFSNLGGAGGHYRLHNLFLYSGGGSLLAKLFSTRFARSSTKAEKPAHIYHLLYIVARTTGQYNYNIICLSIVVLYLITISRFILRKRIEIYL